METSLEPRGILTPAGQFTIAELCAMEHDGVLVRVFGQAFRSVVEPESPALRAAALVHQIPAAMAGRGVLGRGSAAWIHGCAPPPVAICLLLDRDHRTTMLPPLSGCTLHEVKLGPYDVEQLDGALVTCALRTAVDIAMHEPSATALPVLLAFSTTPRLNCPLGHINAAIATTHHIPGRKRGLALLRRLLAEHATPGKG